MPVDPVIKQDLMLVKNHFEQEALKQDDDAALVPIATILRAQNDAHRAVRDGVKRYPAYYGRNLDANQSILEKIQDECIPCSKRISILKDVDISPRIDDTLLVYNRNVLTQLKQMFKNLNGRNPVETHLCDFYKSWRTQCIPDIRRAIAALTYLINDIRGFDLKSLKENFLQTILALLAGLVVNISFNFDKYAQLITDTLKCVISDIRTQLQKIEPILSRESRFEQPPETISVRVPNSDGTLSDFAVKYPNPNKEPIEVKRGVEATKENLVRAWRQNQEDKEWITSQQPSLLYQPLPPNDTPFDKQLTEFSDKLSDINRGAQEINQIIEDQVNEAIRRIDANVIATRQELVKILKANGQDMKALNKFIQQILIIQGILRVLKGIAESKGDFDPCGEIEEGRRFFTRLKLPDRRVIIDTEGDPDDPDDIEITIIQDPTNIDNPIVEDILRDAGIINDSNSKKLESGEVVLSAEPMTISLFACLGKTPRD